LRNRADSRFVALEPPNADERAVTVGINRPLAGIVADLLARQAEAQGI